MDNKYVFISYSHHDSDKVLAIIDAMKEKGVALWYDEGIEAGTEWPEYIAERIYEASVFIAFMSPHAAASMNCRNEINYAISLGKEMLIVYLEETSLSAGMQLQLGSLQAMFYSRSKNNEEFVYNLVHSKILQKLLVDGEAPVSEKKPEAPAPKKQPKADTAPPTTKAVADNKKEVTPIDAKRKLISNIVTPLFAILAVVVGILEMHFVTKYIENGFLIFLFGVLGPILVLVPFELVYSFKIQRYSKDAADHVYSNCAAFFTLAFLAQVIADPFYIHCTERVIFKILISLGINILSYFIVLLTGPQKYEQK